MMFEDVVAGVWALEETKVCLPIPLAGAACGHAHA
jgi:hypothetical protein